MQAQYPSTHEYLTGLIEGGAQLDYLTKDQLGILFEQYLADTYQAGKYWEESSHPISNNTRKIIQEIYEDAKREYSKLPCNDEHMFIDRRERAQDIRETANSLYAMFGGI